MKVIKTICNLINFDYEILILTIAAYLVLL